MFVYFPIKPLVQCGEIGNLFGNGRIGVVLIQVAMQDKTHAWSGPHKTGQMR